ncbi:MAG TPA: hypothetical protein DEO87_00575, partial [Lachnospiraceae bacterium]|nr:hypothetical protein [Lachnospiraceae bacterium]
DINEIDPYHLEAYGETTVNYNRDIEVFPVLNAMFKKIYGDSPYKSPTDMGVNMAGNCISDDAVTREAGKQEIIRRYYKESCALRKGSGRKEIVSRIETIMQQAGIGLESRKCATAANVKAELTGLPAAAIELEDGTVISGKTTNLLGASSAMLLNALKYLAGLADEIILLAPSVIEPIQHLKVHHLGDHNPLMHINEVLIALTMCAENDENARLALAQLDKLRGCEAHSSVILSGIDENVFSKLGVYLTCEPKYQTNKMYHQ